MYSAADPNSSVGLEEDLGLLRPQLYVVCYQLLASAHDAEDAMQETMLRAWRSLGSFDPDRASLRTWTQRIATNVCLTALTGRARRPLPADLGEPGLDPDQPLVAAPDIPWLEPAPSSWFAAHHGDPADRALARGDLRIAVTALLQGLPARQRAVVILRDVLAYSAAETAEVLGMSVAACNSALQRARATLPQIRTPRAVPAEAVAVVERYAAAFERADVATLVSLVADDLRFEMPPVPQWSIGAGPYARFMQRLFGWRGTAWSTRLGSANGQPALEVSLIGADGPEPHTIQVLDVDRRGVIRHLLVHQDAALFDLFVRNR